jgi:hypothetical protein
MSVITDYSDTATLKNVAVVQKGTGYQLLNGNEPLYFNVRVKVHSVNAKYITVHCPADIMFKKFINVFQDAVRERVMSHSDVDVEILPLIYVNGDDTLMKLYYSKDSTILFNSSNEEIDLDVSAINSSHELLTVLECPNVNAINENTYVMPFNICQLKIKRVTNCMIVEPVKKSTKRVEVYADAGDSESEISDEPDEQPRRYHSVRT